MRSFSQCTVWKALHSEGFAQEWNFLSVGCYEHGCGFFFFSFGPKGEKSALFQCTDCIREEEGGGWGSAGVSFGGGRRQRSSVILRHVRSSSRARTSTAVQSRLAVAQKDAQPTPLHIHAHVVPHTLCQHCSITRHVVQPRGAGGFLR